VELLELLLEEDELLREIELDWADRDVAALNELEVAPVAALEVLATLELSLDPPVDTLGVLPEEPLRPVDWTCCGTSLPPDPPRPCLPAPLRLPRS